MISTGDANTASQVRRALQDTASINASAQAVRRAPKEAGMRSAVKKKKPMLKPRHIKDRCNFAKKYEYWTFEDWSRVI